MVIPGALWSAIFIVLSMLPLWLETYFPGVIWVAPAAGLLAIVLKVWEVYKPQDAPDTPSFEDKPAPEPGIVRKSSKGKRLWLG